MSVSHIWQIRNGTGKYASQWDLETEPQENKNSGNMTQGFVKQWERNQLLKVTLEH